MKDHLADLNHIVGGVQYIWDLYGATKTNNNPKEEVWKHLNKFLEVMKFFLII